MVMDSLPTPQLRERYDTIMDRLDRDVRGLERGVWEACAKNCLAELHRRVETYHDISEYAPRALRWVEYQEGRR